MWLRFVRFLEWIAVGALACILLLHCARLIRELLAFEPQSKGTDIKMALDKVNQILKRRSIVFLVSDFMADPSSSAGFGGM